MSFIGNQPANSFESPKKQVSTSNSGTTITLDYPVTSVADIRLTINAVVQSYDNYSVSGSTLTVGGTLNNDRVEILFVGRTYGSISPSDGSINTNAIVDSAVTNVKLGSDINATKLTAGLVPTARLGSGTASSSTVLYGDQTYKTAPSGSFVYLGGINASNHNANTLRLEQVFANDYRRYKVMGKFQGTGNGADIRFRWLKSDNNEEQNAYYNITDGGKSNSVSFSNEDWIDWNQQYARMFKDTATGTHIHGFTMELFPNQNENVNYPTAIFHTQTWDYNSGGNRQRIIQGAIYNEITTSMAGGGMQLQSTSGLFGTVNMSIWGYKDS
jgi:hypothetical protein